MDMVRVKEKARELTTSEEDRKVMMAEEMIQSSLQLKTDTLRFPSD